MMNERDVKPGELFHRQFSNLLRACAVRGANGHRKNSLLRGPAGSGKSNACEQVARWLGLDFYYTGQTLMPHDLIGYANPHTGDWVQTGTTRAFLHGGVIVWEEMDGWSANATLAANPLLANGILAAPDGTVHHRHPDCIIIACTNTWGLGATAEYVGRNRLDAAFLDRFAFKIDWSYDQKLERTVAGNDEVVDFVQTCRLNAQKAGIKVLITPRSSIDISDMVKAGFTLGQAADMNFLASLDRDQKRTVMQDTEHFFDSADDAGLPFKHLMK